VKNEGNGNGHGGMEQKHMAIHVEPAERTIIMPPAIGVKVQYRRQSNSQEKKNDACDGASQDDFIF